MPTFCWGTLPQPNMGEYNRRQGYYDFLYSLPYYLAGVVITLVGCGATPLLLKQLRASSAHSLRNANLVTLVLLILVAMISDAGTLLGLWRSPVFLLHRDYPLVTIRALSKIFLPASFLSGAIAVAGQRF